MKLRRLLSKEVYIRLADDETAFLVTVTYGKIYYKQTEFAVEPPRCPKASAEPARVMSKGSGIRTRN